MSQVEDAINMKVIDSTAGISSFPKIFNIGDSSLRHLFNGPLEITEKVDGSQFAFGLKADGTRVFRSKGQTLHDRVVPGMFEDAALQVERMFPVLEAHSAKNDIFVYCEYLQKPKHNVLCYDRVPTNNLYLFGIKFRGEFINNYSVLSEWANLLEVDPPNVLYTGEITSAEQLDLLIEEESYLGGCNVEGIVMKNYNATAIKGNILITPCMGKYVSDKFREKHKSNWKGEHTSKGKLFGIIGSLQTDARWEKGVQHLRDNDELEDSPRDIGPLLKEIKRDILEEEEGYIKDKLFAIFKDEIVKGATRGFPEWYKDRLMKSAFDTEEKDECDA